MKNLKKVTALLLAIVMVLGLCPMGVFADGNTKTMTITSDAPERGVQAGDTFEVTYSFEGGADAKIRSLTFEIPYDSSKVSVENVSGYPVPLSITTDKIKALFVDMSGAGVSVAEKLIVSKIKVTVLEGAEDGDELNFAPASVTYQAPGVAGNKNDVTIENEALREVYVPATYAITFDANGGTGEMDDMSVAEGESLVLPECEFTAPDGMNFGGWEIDGDTYDVGRTVEITDDTTVKAIWTDLPRKILTVTTDAPSHGVAPGDSFHFIYSLVGAPGLQIRAIEYDVPVAYTKIGVEHVEGYRAGFAVVGEGTKLRFIYNDKTYVGYDSSVEEVIAMVKVTVKEDTTLDDVKLVPAKVKYWIVGETGSYDDIKIVEDFTIRIVAPRYDVVFDSNGGTGTIDSLIVDENEKIILPNDEILPPNGKAFDGWEIDGKKYNIGDEITVTKDIVVKAIWKDIKYTVSIKPGEGSGATKTISAVYGDVITLPECTFEAPEHKVFKAWGVNDKEYKVGDGITVKGNTTIKAIWKYVPDEGDSKVMIITTDAPAEGVRVGEKFNINYYFIGAEGDSVRDLEFEMPYDNKKLLLANIAGYPTEFQVGIDSVKVDFSSKAGISVDEEKVTAKLNVSVKKDAKIGDKIKFVPDVVRYRYLKYNTNWFTDVTIIDATDITVVGEIFYNVAYDASGGTGEMEADTIKENTMFALPECGFTAPEGMEFDGWEIDGTKYAVGDEIEITSAITVVAKWKEVVVIPPPPSGDEDDEDDPNDPNSKRLTITSDAPENIKPGDKFNITYSLKGNEGDKIRTFTFEIPYDNTKFAVENVYGYPMSFSVTSSSLKVLYADLSGGMDLSEKQDVAKIEVTVLAGVEEGDLVSFAPEVVTYQVPGVAGSKNDVTIKDKTNITVGEGGTSEPQTYTVEYDANGGSGDEVEAETVDAGEEITLPEPMFDAPENRVFKAWEIDGREYAVGDKYVVNSNIVIKAIWQSVMAEGDTKMLTITSDAPKKVKAGDVFNVTYALAGQTGDKIRTFTFEIPYDNSKVSVENVSGYPMSFSVTDTKLKVLYADLSGGMDLSNAKDIAKIKVTVLDGVADGDKFSFAPEVATYQVQGVAGSKSDVTIADETNIQVGEEGVEPDEPGEPEEPDEPKETFTITYRPNGGGGTMAPETIEEGSILVLPECEFTAPEGMEFSSWKIGATLCNPGDEFEVYSNISVTAQWKESEQGEDPDEPDEPDTPVEPAETFTVTYKANGGSGTMDDTVVTEGTVITLPECGFTAPEGKEFFGWKVGATIYNVGDEFAIYSNISVTAQWQDKEPGDEPEEPDTNSKKMTVKVDGPETIKAGDTFTATYSLVGQTGDKIRTFTFEIPYDGSKISVENVSGYPMSFSVTDTKIKVLYADLSGGMDLSSEKEIAKIKVTVLDGAADGDVITLIPATATYQVPGVAGNKNDVTMKGDTSIVIGGATEEPDEPDTPVEPETYQVTFDANGGSGEMESVTLKAGEWFTLPECGFTAPEGKMFDVWQIDSIICNVGSQILMNANKIIKARWKDAPVAPDTNSKKMTVKVDGPETIKAGDTFTATYSLADTVGDAIRTFTFEIPYDNSKISVENVSGYPMSFSVTSSSLKVLYADLSGGMSVADGKEIAKIKVTVLDGAADGDVITLVPASATYQVKGVAGNKNDVTIKGDTSIVIGGSDEPDTPPEPEKYDVKFNANGGSGEMDDEVAIEGALFVLPECMFEAPEGKEFDAWEIDGIRFEAGAQVSIVSDTTVKALWKDKVEEEPEIFVVKYNANGGSGSMADVLASEGARITLPTCGFTAPDGKIFDAWEIDGNRYQVGTKVTITANTTIKALWKDESQTSQVFTIKYNANGGSGSMPTVTIFEGTRFILPECGFTAPEGMKFDIWEINGAKYGIGAQIIVNSDVTIKALWKDLNDVPVTVTVKYNANGGSGSMSSVIVDYGQRFILPECGFIAPDGKVFDVWEINGIKYGAGATYIVESNIVAKAVWKSDGSSSDIYTISYNANGGTGSMRTALVTRGEEITLPECGFTAPEGKMFDAWEINGYKYEAGAQFVVIRDTAIKALWKDIPLAETYIITYDMNGGSGLTTATAIEGVAFVLPSDGFTAPEGKELVGWEIDGIRYGAGTTYIFTKDTIVKALWMDAETSTYTVSYIANGGTGQMTDLTIEKGDSFVLPICTFIAPQYKIFDAWEINGERYSAGTEVSFDFDITVKALWKDIIYNITFDGNGAEGSMEDMTAVAGEKLALPECGFTVPYGKEFDGWEINGIKIGNVHVFTADAVVKARWKSITYTVTFDENGAEGSMGSQNAYMGEDFILPRPEFAAPVFKVFDGWEINGVKYAVGEAYKFTENTVIKALWRDITYSITFDANGGSGSMEGKIAKAGVALVLPENAFIAPENKMFDGWEVNGVKLGRSHVFTADAVVKAIWKDITYPVIYNMDGGSGLTFDEAIKGQTYSLPTTGFIAPAYKVFDGWEIDGVKYAAGDKVEVDGELIIKALWRDITYVITYDMNGGSGLTSDIAIAGEAFELPEYGFTGPKFKDFGGWEINGVKLGRSHVFTADAVVKAIWKDIYCTIYYSVNTGSGYMEPSTAVVGDEVVLPVPTYDAPANKVFDGWIVGGVKYAAGDKVIFTANTTIVAQWKHIVYTVSFDANGGEGIMNSLPVNAGTSYALPDCVFTAPAHQVFVGWEIDGVKYNAGEVFTFTADTTLKALWEFADTGLLYGDADGNGERVEYEDIDAVVNHYLEYKEITEKKLFNQADVATEYGVLDYDDIDALVNYYLEYISIFPVEETLLNVYLSKNN